MIDSHAHYNNHVYKKPFRYLTYDKDGYTLKEGDREQLFRELRFGCSDFRLEDSYEQI